ncbi:aldehyde dehydrogenase family protein [Nocardioides sp. WS12]|uniref:aldehyde dehydrogenase family protein n=1 Tax=Nocardioides sp. WS12 TaxID=2486272 RepID=UPI0015FCE4E5|nr:aldehyde dehydrogenase family protein [Nocardioides sp. WS12]
MTGTSVEVTSPVDGRLVGTVPDQPSTQVADVVAGLRGAQPAWEALDVAGRTRWLVSYRAWLLDHGDELNRILQSETGKPWAEASLELPAIIDQLNYYLAIAPGLLKDERPRPHGLLTATKRQLLVRRPHAVVGNITPWNFPLALSLADSLPALIAGAAVVVKPSELTPLTVAAAIGGWDEIGAPPVFACVTGLGATGAAVVDAVDYVQFTGSTRTGKLIAQRAGERLVPYSLELGGKDAMLVLADADLERAANAAVWGGFANAGQMCTSVERVYVEAPVYEEFVGLVADKTRELRVGDDAGDYTSDVGPLVASGQVDIVGRHVQEALAAGAKALVGGNRGEGPGNFFEPTVLVDVDETMACVREETFGPTLPIMKVADADEAVRRANDSPYGLSAVVFSRDAERAESVARRLDAGAVNINDVFANLFTLPLPMSGWKQSGIGARYGEHGLLKFCRTQAIVSARLAPKRELQWYPYTRARGTVIRRATRFLGARDLRRRLGG